MVLIGVRYQPNNTSIYIDVYSLVELGDTWFGVV